MMKSNKISSHKQAENWVALEKILSKNLQPVSPRLVFIDNLRTRLENPNSVTLETVGKTSRFIIAVIGIITGLIFMVIIVRLFIYVFSGARKRQEI